MKTCIICHKEHDRQIALKCHDCSKQANKLCKLKYYHSNKDKVNEYQKVYRAQNKKLCRERSKKSALKKPEYYSDKKRERYRKIRGIPLDDPFRKRKDGEGTIDSCGYKTITKRGHPNQMDWKGRIREHVFIMSEFLGRPLTKQESVHHRNGDRLDNKIENLELWHKGQPPGQRVEDKIKYYIEFLNSYGYKVSKD